MRKSAKKTMIIYKSFLRLNIVLNMFIIWYNININIEEKWSKKRIVITLMKKAKKWQ